MSKLVNYQPPVAATDWSKYNKTFGTGLIAQTVATGSYTTIINVSGKGYLNHACCKGVSSAIVKIKVTIDSVVTFEGYSSIQSLIGILSYHDITWTGSGYAGQIVYFDLSIGGPALSETTTNATANQRLVQLPFITDNSRPSDVALIYQPLYFNTSCKVEVQAVSGGTTANIYIGGMIQ